ncbi:MAG: aminopeptidase [Collinsella sp.]
MECDSAHRARRWPGPGERLGTHDAAFEKNLRFLNDNRFDYLHYTAANGTDLTIGMTKGHEWAGGKGRRPMDTPSSPTFPPRKFHLARSHARRRYRVLGHAAHPPRNKVEDFWIKFEGGRVVDYDARVGKATLASIIDTDEGAAHLGEVALISKNTPIRESGVLFYDTLYDENASCHLALGVGFPECIEGGYDMSKEELLEHGVNVSSTHVDFMIGTDDIDITGITPDGREVVIFQNGQWSWE